MSAFSWILTAIGSIAAITGYTLLLVLYARQNQHINKLQQQLDIFVDSSISVARTVEQLIQMGPRQNIATVASRRWVLQEAKSRLMQGENILDIATPLGLSKDEVRLLNTQLH